MARKRAKARQVDTPVPDHIVQVFHFVQDMTPCFLVSKDWNAEVRRRFPQLAELDKLNSYQKRTFDYIDGYRLKNVVAAVERICVVCQKSWRGSIHETFGFPAHPECVKNHVVGTNHLRLGDAREFVLSRIPSCVLMGYSRHTGTQFEYDAVWERVHPAIPDSWTVEGCVAQNAVAIAEYAAEQGAIRAAAEAVRLEAERAAADAERVRKEAWTAAFAQKAKELRAPFRSYLGMRRKLKSHLSDYVRVEDAEATVRRGIVACAFMTRVASNFIWRWIFEGDDFETRAPEAVECQEIVPRGFWMSAFFPGTNPRSFAGEYADAFVEAVSNALYMGDRNGAFDIYRLYPDVVVAYRRATHVLRCDVARLGERLALLATLPADPRVPLYVSAHADRIAAIAASYQRAIAVDPDAFARWGTRCLCVPETEDVLAFMEPAPNASAHTGACVCGNAAAVACVYNTCCNCCPGPCMRHNK